MLPAVIGLASSGLLLLSREENLTTSAPGVDLGQETEELEVPLSLTRKEWMAFLAVAKCGNPTTVSESNRIGSFGFTIRRLCDLGLMANPQSVRRGKDHVWIADWVTPSSLEAFQADPMLQYDVFVSSTKRYARTDLVKEAIGSNVDGAIVSLSGAVMLAHRAGLAGMNAWLSSAKDRQKYAANTTSFFTKANGLF